MDTWLVQRIKTVKVLVNSVNDSCKGGRDSWLVNWVSGKIDEAVVAAKSWRQSAEVLLDLETLLRGSGELKKGDGQQLLWEYRHTCEASSKQGDCIFSVSLKKGDGQQLQDVGDHSPHHHLVRAR